MKDKTFYITTTLPYVNAEPHIGFAAEIVHADILARWHALLGEDIFFNTGTDEHGQKIFDSAGKVGKDAQKYVDEYAEKFRGLKDLLGLWEGLNFVRTTDQKHIHAAQEFWKKVRDNGFIYKKNYKTKYCVGCELEKTDSELVDGRCPIHPNSDLEIREEENYFFKFSAFTEKLQKLYSDRPDFVVPDFRFNEIKAFVGRGLEDFSISRLKSKMSWGVPVPGDEDHVMYVWFDALVNYIDVVGWPIDAEAFTKWWPGVQIAGKDNLRQQSAMWQAMLMAADLPNSKQVIIRGFINAEGGQKMSKSLGNVINPYDVVAEYGTEALRYFLAREVSPFEDTVVTNERIKETYNSGLANGLGNLVSRVLKMAETNLPKPIEIPTNSIPEEFKNTLERYDVKAAADIIWKEITALDTLIQEKQPFKVVKVDTEAGVKIIEELCVRLYAIGEMLVPFMPETSEKIKIAVKENKMPSAPLFLRKD